MESPQRNLKAIMFTDIEGFTSMMQENEEEALTMRQLHREIFTSTTEKFQGDIIQYFGDGTLSTFGSVLQAVQCAVELQKQWLEHDIKVRIGIHLGDIVIYEDEILGDAVNIASRIQSIGENGTILVSDKTYEALLNHKQFSWVKLGRFKLKNVAAPPEIYALAIEGIQVPKTLSAESSEKAWPRSKWLALGLVVVLAAVIAYMLTKSPKVIDQDQIVKRLAVAPFKNFVGEEELNKYIVEGLKEDLVTELSTLRGIKVVSSRATEELFLGEFSLSDILNEFNIHYLLEGSITQVEDTLKVNVQLVDIEHQNNVWTHSFEDLYGKNSYIYSQVKGAISELLDAQYLAARGLNNEFDPGSIRLYLAGSGYLHAGADSIAKEYFVQSINADSTNTRAWIRLFELRSFEYGENVVKELTGIKGDAMAYLNTVEKSYLDAHILYHKSEFTQSLAALNQIDGSGVGSSLFYLLRSRLYTAVNKDEEAARDSISYVERGSSAL